MGNVQQICGQVQPKNQFENQRDKLLSLQKKQKIQIKISEEDKDINQNKNQTLLSIKSETPKIKQSSFSFCNDGEKQQLVRDSFVTNTFFKDRNQQTKEKSEEKNIIKISQTKLILNQITKLVIKRQGKTFLYEGETMNQQMHGYGKILDQATNKIIYQGQFKNNYFDGWGFSQFYQGEFKLNKYQGYGVYKQFLLLKTDTITNFYEGYFRNGSFEGKGILIKNCRLPKSQLQKIHQLGVFNYIYSEIEHNMQIIKKFQVEQIYVGQFSKGLKHGYGRLFKQNFEFSGQFSHDFYHGLGTSYFNMKNGQQKAVQAVFKMGKQLQN